MGMESMRSGSNGQSKRIALVWTCLALLAGCGEQPGHVLDEAQRAKRNDFKAADEDYFVAMDKGIKLAPEEIKGRNTWLVWTGGDDRLWDKLTNATFGAFDLLKTISSYPGSEYSRDNRWKYFGLINEPCFSKAGAPDAERFGLWLDQRSGACPPDPFANEQKYPGVVIGARGKTLPAGSYYGYPTGIVGLRLFPNPDFDEAAAKKWDAKRYYTDPKYYEDKDLVRPYRVGMSCGFCHVGPSPLHPPADPENPKWENLSSTVGSQYFWVDRIFMWNIRHDNFVYQWLHTARPGTLDTSLVSSDNINNPRTMNAIYNLGDRLQLASRWGKETLAGPELNNKQLNDYFTDGPLTQFYAKPVTLTPRVLKDGADSVGALGALNRVYINIGLFSEEWLLHFKPVVGGKPVTPIQIADAEKNSSYWRATEAQTKDMALFLVKASAPDKLKDAPGGAAYLTRDKAQLERGKVVFAERCARCHSSKIPTGAPDLDAGVGCSGPGYLACWNRYWDWTKTDEFKGKMKEMVLKDDFLEGNYLSTELRVPVTLLKTNACSPLATNAIRGNIWDNFSSQTYKDLPSVGTITYYHPVTGEEKQYPMPAGGRGYTRPASLVSLWSTAPFLLNNSVGPLHPEYGERAYAAKWEGSPNPSVETRMKVFESSIEQMLWPEKRDKDELLGDKIPGRMDRTTERSFLRVSSGYLPDAIEGASGLGRRLAPWLFGDDGIEIGPIPKGTPVNLLMNLNLRPEEGADLKPRIELLKELKKDLKALPKDATDEDAKKVFANVVDKLLALSKCPDFIVNRGHYFGTDLMKEEPGLSDVDKRALIEFLKTL